MTEPENFEDDLFADLYENEEESASKPQAAAPEQHSASATHPEAQQDSYDPAADPNQHYQNQDGGGGDTYMNHGDGNGDEEDDDVDFNLGNGTGGAHHEDSSSSYNAPQQHAPAPPTRGPNAKEDGKMFIGGLNWETTDQSLRDYFSQFGEVLECTVMRDGATGRSRGFGFLTFKDPKTVNIVMVKEHYLDGKIIDPKRAIPRDEQEKTSKIFVGGVSQETTDHEFREYFARFGRVVDATLMMDKDTGRPRGFGFVTFESDAGVEACLAANLEIHGKPIEVKKAQPRGNMREEEEAAARRGGGGGGGGKFGRKGGDRSGQGMDDGMGGGGGGGGQVGQANAAAGGMTPQVMAQYWQRMQQYFAMMQQQMAMNRGAMNMNPQMMQMMQMQQMQQMMAAQQRAQGGAAGGAGGMAAMMQQNPAMMQQMQQMMQQQQQGMPGGGGMGGGPAGGGMSPAQAAGGMSPGGGGGSQHGGSNSGGGGSRGGFNQQQQFEQQYEQEQPQQQRQPKYREQQQQGGYGGGGYGMGGGAGPTSWEGMYDDVPQPMMNQGPMGGGRGGFHKNRGAYSNNQQQMVAQGPQDPAHAPPANAPTGPKNAGKPGANYRGGGRGGNRGFHPYSRG